MQELDVVDILLVEDNPCDSELIIRALKKHHLANRIVHVDDGAAAIDFVFGQGSYTDESPQSPKVILLDLKLPKTHGLGVLKAIKTNERTRRIPVVIMTSSCEHPDVQAAYDLGANGYVVKPVEFERFMETMNRVGLFWLVVNQPPD